MKIPIRYLVINEILYLYLVYDRVEGESYEEIRQKRSPEICNEYEMVKWLNQILPILSNLHSKNTSHRNLSPQNIICVGLEKLPVLTNFAIEQEIEPYIQGETATIQPWNVDISDPKHRDLRNLAVTALILVSGKDSKDLYDVQKKRWNWEEILLLSDRRKKVFRWILEYGLKEKGWEGSTLSADAISQRINTILPTEMPSAKLPWKFFSLSLGGILLLFLIGLGFASLQKKPEVISSEDPPQAQYPECPSGSDFVAIACGVQVTDVDSKNFEKGKLTIEFTENATADDRIEIYNLNPTSQETQSDSYPVTYENTIIGHVTGGTETKPLEVIFNSNANPKVIQELVHQIIYRNTSSQPNIGTRTVKLQLTDGDGGTSDAVTRVIGVNTPNRQPAIQLPKPQKVEEDKQLTFGGISVSDSDADSNGITVQLKVSNGSLQIRNDVPDGLGVREIQQKEIGHVEITSTVDRINNTLSTQDAITYQSNSNFDGTDKLTVIAQDRGKSGTDNDNFIWPPDALKPRKSTKKTQIIVQPINDNPKLISIGAEPEPEPKLEIPETVIYNSGSLPVGSYSFYENNLQKDVSYIRQGNIMTGALYNAQQPNTFTCFEAIIREYDVTVQWQGNLGLIGRQGETLNSNYSIYDFTVGNGALTQGLKNSNAVQQCQNQL